MEVIRNQEFVLLPANEIAKLLASDDMNIPNEETILNALLTWVRHDLEQRRKDLSKLLAYIRLPLLAPQVINWHSSTGVFLWLVCQSNLYMYSCGMYQLKDIKPTKCCFCLQFRGSNYLTYID